MEPFYYTVKIEGTALVYAENEQAAYDLLREAGVMVAGNKMRDAVIDVIEPDVRPRRD